MLSTSWTVVALTLTMACYSVIPVYASLCDPLILAAINRLPKNQNIIQTGLNNIKEVVLATSDNYYSPSPQCLFSFFTPWSFFLVKIQRFGTPTLEEHLIQEVAPGLLVEPDTGVERTHFISKGNLTGFYKCSPNGRPGIAEGLLKGRAGSFNSRDYQQAISLMKSVGIELKVQYPFNCP